MPVLDNQRHEAFAHMTRKQLISELEYYMQEWRRAESRLTEYRSRYASHRDIYRVVDQDLVFIRQETVSVVNNAI